MEDIDNDNKKTLNSTVSFEMIQIDYRSFMYSNNYRPTCIIIHPKDGEILIELIHKEYGYAAMPNLLAYRDMKIFRSFDIEEGKWILK